MIIDGLREGSDIADSLSGPIPGSSLSVESEGLAAEAFGPSFSVRSGLSVRSYPVNSITYTSTTLTPDDFMKEKSKSRRAIFVGHR